MPFVAIYYHSVWSTKGRADWLTATIERDAITAIREKSADLACPVYAINGALNHMHIAVRIQPKIAVATWVQQVKGLSARRVNELNPDLDEHSRWQHSYRVHTFGTKALPFVVAYIENQKEHHALGTTEDYLERLD